MASGKELEADYDATRMRESLEFCIRARHSIRVYKEDPVPKETLQSCLKLAQLAPSNSNMQNWRMALAQGQARERIVAALRTAASEGAPNIPPLPEKFKHFRSEFGKELYSEQGYHISREDKEGLAQARFRNFDFFGAPVIGLVSTDKALSSVDAMSVGLFVQTFMLALTERGLGSCLEVSVTGYGDVLASEFGLEGDQMILCGIAIGWPADHPINQMHVQREPLEKEVRFLE